MAKALGAARAMEASGNDGSFRLPGWALRIKTRATAPAWLWAALDQAARDAGPDEYPAVVLAHVSQGRKARRLVLLDFAHFRALVGGEDGEQSAGEG